MADLIELTAGPKGPCVKCKKYEMCADKKLACPAFSAFVEYAGRKINPEKQPILFRRVTAMRACKVPSRKIYLKHFRIAVV